MHNAAWQICQAALCIDIDNERELYISCPLIKKQKNM